VKKAQVTASATSYLYGGNLLLLDLTHREATIVPTTRYAPKYIGGRGTNARLVYENVGPQTDPLGSDNVLCFGTGPLTGTLFPGSSRTDVMGKSPVTGLLGNSNFGGEWAAELKNAGWDHVVLQGRAEDPVYISIHNDTVKIRDARGLWGTTTYEVEERIRAELDNPEVKIACIGPAGENLVTFADIRSDLGHAAGRGGLGAVMGSKNVKAIAVRGTRGVALAQPEAFLEACLDAYVELRSSAAYEGIHAIGHTAGQIQYVNSGGKWGDAADASKSPANDLMPYVDFYKEHSYIRAGCAGCPVQCHEAYNIPGYGATVVTCDLYTPFTVGLRNHDLLFWLKMITKAHQQGIDASSLVTSLQWIWYLWELGIVDESLTDGYRLEWGSQEAIEGLFDSIVSRQGFGDVFAQGMKATADYLDARIPLEKRDGRSTYAWARQVNNNPMWALDAKFPGAALSYSVGRRSDLLADIAIEEQHIICASGDPNLSDEERQRAIDKYAAIAEEIGGPGAGDLQGYAGKAAIVSDIGAIIASCDLLGTCKMHTKFTGMTLSYPHFAAALSAGLGHAMTDKDLVDATFRSRNVERAFECKMGRRREHDTIPEMQFDMPISRGTLKGKVSVSREGLERMKSDYYALRGWDDETGIPCRETLLEYGLDDIATDLDALGILPERARPAPAATESSSSEPAGFAEGSAAP
jgi:aldehyde:ferredoxin oxidoreductase